MTWPLANQLPTRLIHIIRPVSKLKLYIFPASFHSNFLSVGQGGFNPDKISWVQGIGADSISLLVIGKLSYTQCSHWLKII